LHVLLAICKAAPRLDGSASAEKLLHQISPYLLEAHEQSIATSPFLHLIEPSPWEALSYSLVAAELSIGIKFPALHEKVNATINRYLQACAQATSNAAAIHAKHNGNLSDLDLEKALEIGALSISMVGFLEAASLYSHFFSVGERLQMITVLRKTLTEEFLVSVEGAFSSIRTSESFTKVARDWKSYSKRYANSGRPLGAMLLQKGFMYLLVSCSSLQVVPAQMLQQTNLLDYLISNGHRQVASRRDESAALTDMLSEIAAEEMRLLEDGADYLQLGSAWQQRLAFTVKGYALTVFVGCMVMDEDAEDVDILMSWLEDTMADTVEMADDNLAAVVLKSLVISAKISPAIASTLSRSLPRYIVQGGLRGPTVVVAAQCLAFILQLISTDAVITGLYSLGNVLSAGSIAEKGMNPHNEGSISSPKHSSAQYIQQATGSAISLDLSGEEETFAVYGNVVRAVVSIATTCKDSKVIPLAQSLLIQKLGRVSTSVDLHIVVEAATLAASGAETELRALLKLYDKISHDAVVHKNVVLIETVRADYIPSPCRIC
jgi:phosphatidylinositol 4-kinase